MRNWKLIYTPDAEEDMEQLDRSQQIQVEKAIKKVKQNPLPVSEGGYGKPLGNKHGNNLSGCLKVKLKKLGIRIVYTLVRIDDKMIIIVIGARDDNETYDIAKKRLDKFH